MKKQQEHHSYDVIVIGGGATGLGGALTLVRARRSVLVIDNGTPRNAAAAPLHGYLSRDGADPAEHRSDDATFRVDLQDGTSATARRLLVTTGLTDELPDVPGLAERFGRDVLHCPYCHGWEVRDQAIGVLSSGPMAILQAQLFRQWSPHVTLLLHTGPAPTRPERDQLAARGITVISGTVDRLEISDGALTGVRLADGRVIAIQALVAGPRMSARATVLKDLGLVPTEMEAGGLVFASYIAADSSGKTEVTGVWVAGNITNASLQLIGAAAGGVQAGAAINADLINEEIDAAVHSLAQ